MVLVELNEETRTEYRLKIDTCIDKDFISNRYVTEDPWGKEGLFN